MSNSLFYFPLKKPVFEKINSSDPEISKKFIQLAKSPAFNDWQKISTNDQKTINKWKRAGYGLAVDCGKSNLVVLDVDHTDPEEGMWEIDLIHGEELPKTKIARTQGNKFHYYFWGKTKNSVKNKFEHIDIRSVGGYVVAPPSKILGKYTWKNRAEIAEAPEWLIEYLGVPNTKNRDDRPSLIDLDTDASISAAMEYLENDAPISIDEQGGNNNAYGVAAQLHEYGLTPDKIAECMMESGWNDRCEPPWDMEELVVFGENAAKYAVNDAGAATAEYQFPDDLLEDEDLLGFDIEEEDLLGFDVEEEDLLGFDPPKDTNPQLELVREINKEFAVVQDNSGVEIYNFHNCPENGEVIRRMSRKDFVLFHENKEIMIPDAKKPIDIGSFWLKHKDRREYRGIIFDPSKKPLSNVGGNLNLWKGFSVEPKKGDCSYLDKLIKDGLCGGDKETHEYLLNWIAFSFQKPHLPAEVATAMTGKKGTGKSTLSETIGHILGHHSFLVNAPELLTGRFQGHLKNRLFLRVEESFWGGDKRAGNKLKSMITDSTIPIEEKRKTPEVLKNRMSVMISSNEDWVFDASMGDERRLFAIKVTEKYMNNHTFFNKLYRQLNKGGYEAFLFQMLARDIEGWHPRTNIPKTDALMDQQKNSMSYVQKWWYESLEEEALPYPINEEDWEGDDVEILKEDLLEQFKDFVSDLGNRYKGGKVKFKKDIKEFGILEKQSGKKEFRGKRVFVIPKLSHAKTIFNKLF